MLAGIGTVKDQPLVDARTVAILDTAAQTAFKTSKVLFDVSPAKPEARIYPDRQWVNPLLGNTARRDRSTTWSGCGHHAASATLAARVNFFPELTTPSARAWPGERRARERRTWSASGIATSSSLPDNTYRATLPAGCAPLISNVLAVSMR